ncbi:hypothetical protein CBW65_14920 [Tumebacillus avium]|uniref:DUF2268 domain-containing protein n=1 Tax=Tumebacillus avium TaxID=1903704 RepID=A0A1Y0INL6_9BACL|nr:hypothetical protein [Tumebacillus avium]ARU62148.1 hypothetical protein CBW65_14920 [Tumebacillus avium]
MKILDTTGSFFALYEDGEQMTLEKLDLYYQQHPDLFDDYFASHCQRTPERLSAALARYPDVYQSMKQTADRLPNILAETAHTVERLLPIPIEWECRLLVGGFGSNAYVERALTRRIQFAIEKMSPEPAHLQVLAAHEMGHVLHFAWLRQAGFDWGKFAREPHGALYVEGVATLLSQLAVPGLEQSVYLSFDDAGQPWTDYYHLHREEIRNAYRADAADWSFEKEREWFRLSGGTRYGLNRLGYLLGADFVRSVYEERGLTETLTFWAREELCDAVEKWLG